jgi:6-phosphogluconolactonase
MTRARAELRVFPDLAALSAAAAEVVVERAAEAVAARGAFAVALSGGRTPRALYELLGDPGREFSRRVPWEKTHAFFGDERCVPPDHPDSNYGMARAALLARVPIPPGQVHRVRGELADAGQAAAEYEQAMRDFFGEDPVFDLVVLGMGSDGHTASLFPGSAALSERERWVAAPFVEGIGAHRITLTLPVLGRSRAAVFLVAGADKAAALARALGEGPAGERPPAARVRPSGALLWLADRAAAGLLERP